MKRVDVASVCLVILTGAVLYSSYDLWRSRRISRSLMQAADDLAGRIKGDDSE